MKALLARLSGGEKQRMDELAFLARLSVLVFLALSGYAVWRGQAWDPQGYGIGLGAVLAAARISSGVRSWFAPAQSPAPPASGT